MKGRFIENAIKTLIIGSYGVSRNVDLAHYIVYLIGVNTAFFVLSRETLKKAVFNER